MCNFGKNSFTNYENTFGVIYIVRDPRNDYFNFKFIFKKNYEEAKNFFLMKKNLG